MNLSEHENSRVTFSHCNSTGNTTNSNNKTINEYNIFISDEERQVLEWLSPLTSRERHRVVRDSRMEGVGDWLLWKNEFSTWHTSEGSVAKRVLLCYGDPGVGKTYISSLVIDTLSKGINGADVAVPYVYCDFNARNVQSASAVLGSVLRQVVGALAEIPDEVQKAFNDAKNHVDGCGPLLPEILEMLTKSLSSLKRVFICIDALDEFPENHRAQLWKSLQRVVQECSSTRLFLTGRPHIRAEVESYFPTGADMVSIDPSPDDIRLYIKKKLEYILNTNGIDRQLRADILRVIPEKASGIFLLASLDMDAILAGATNGDRRRALNRRNRGHSLKDAYKSTLDRIWQQGESKSKLGMAALMWVSCSERPLKMEELRHAVGVELGQKDFNIDDVPSTRNLLDYTLGLITTDNETSTVRLLHFTLQEYLVAHHTPPISNYSKMAEICLTYLNYHSGRALPPNLDAALAATPFLEYATCFWGTHAASEMTEAVKSLALRLLDGYENHVSAAIFCRKKIDKWRFVNDTHGISGLHCIAFWGIAKIATAMLENAGWDANGCDSDGDTPLMWAVKYGNDSIVKLLLARGDVNPNTPDNYGLTPLSYAARDGQEGLVKLLLRHRNVKPNSLDDNGLPPISYAAMNGRENVVKLLLECRDIDPNSSGSNGLPPLSYAAMNAQDGVVELLLNYEDVNPNLSDNRGRTSLSLAASRGHKGVAKLLLEHGGVDPNLSDNDGLTPLSCAVMNGREDVVNLLLGRRDVNPNLSGNDGLSPLSYAAKWGREELVKMFLERGDLKPDSSDKRGRTPSSFAASRGHLGIVKLFLWHGDVNPDSSDNDGKTPLSYAVENKREGVVKLLSGP